MAYVMPVSVQPREGQGMAVRVLLVDDDHDIHWLLKIILQGDPTVLLVGEAFDGESAIAEVRLQRPDVVLMDLMMPWVDGLEATRRIKEQWPETKVLILTALSPEASRDAAYESGADGFVSKQDMASSVLPAIRAVTRRPPRPRTHEG